MKRVLVSPMAVLMAICLVVVGCGQTTPPPAPTKAPAAPTKAPEAAKAPAEATKAPVAPTKAPEPAKPTAAPAKKVEFPAKNKAIMWIIPWPAGGSNDVGARLVAPYLEKEWGTSVEIVNKGGAGTQVGLTEITRARPDGYTIGQATLPTNVAVYLDAQRKAAFSGKDLQPVANYSLVPQAISVKADSPIKTVKDLVDAAKANPGKVRVADPGLLTASHLAVVLLERVAGVKFAQVHFDGGAPALAAMLGGHVEAQTSSLPVVLPQMKGGEVRVLGIEEERRHELYPDIPTVAEQGYKAYISSYYGVLMPAGVQPEILDILTSAVKNSLGNAELRKKLEEIGQPPLYLDPTQFSKAWKEQEELVQSILKDEATKK